jgi:hypothetical protein
MTASPDRRLTLARMEVAQAETQRQLGVIERQIAARAKRLMITDRAKRRQQSRSASNWTIADERLSQQHLAELALARRDEIDALTRKLDLQRTAIAAFRKRSRISAPRPMRDQARHHCEPKRGGERAAGVERAAGPAVTSPGFSGG